eukprot:TRINITY_DN74554_c0_g1_i1.p1 TRINITY_DN74554_c0_g1~~TRINITY_DN74554_c0_g1_i1.p1  ORF type:complete len:284 (+),score=40.03 TRINITY_DN74554_c0_g1_i1:47-898(+)
MSMPKDELEAWCAALEAIVAQPGQTTIEASEVEPWLLLGGKPAAEEAVRENRRGVTHVLNCCEPWCAMGPGSSRLIYKGIQAYDESGYPLLELHYEQAARPFLDMVRQAGGVCLVHCAMGVNRSAAIVVAYLIDRIGLDLLTAVERVRQARGCILGNDSFRVDLVHFAADTASQRHLGGTAKRDQWVAKRPPPLPEDPLKVDPPPESWRTLPVSVGMRVRVRQCGDEWADGTIWQFEDGCWSVSLDDGSEDCVQADSPDICANPLGGSSSVHDYERKRSEGMA